jgi:hypothetical protein
MYKAFYTFPNYLSLSNVQLTEIICTVVTNVTAQTYLQCALLVAHSLHLLQFLLCVVKFNNNNTRNAKQTQCHPIIVTLLPQKTSFEPLWVLFCR